MTLILATLQDGHVVMGGDRCYGSALSGVPEIYTSLEPKIWQADGVLLGVCGSGRLSQILRRELPPFPDGSLTEWIDGPVTDLLVDVHRRQLEISDLSMLLAATASEIVAISYVDQSWMEAQRTNALSYICVGSGRHWAYGACYTAGVLGVGPRDATRLGLEAAAKHCAGVAEPFDVLEAGGAS